ncbi:glycosyltransferase family 2 protein [Oceaniglobus ichthyenteri]|uniref:glycosyltransferase family 2 protein n=1 Tax=Oceaniglobus ichthyenteri TaxID=2136177 RepID=UPI001F0B8E96|nr:glycosyltransferase family 2 protein [Oceaniglobus ichthyenteri]
MAKGSKVRVSDPIIELPVKNTSRHGTITAVSMMKDEGPYLLEWVAHHLAVGFTDLLVYTNDCSDGTDDMLIRLQELGLAHHRRNDIPDGMKPQPSAIKYATREPVVQNSDWVLVFDADEFLSIKYGDGTLDPLLDAVTEQGASGMVITWRIFGSGGVVDWSRDMVTEQYLMAAPAMWNKGWGVKTLFKYDPNHWRLGIHRPKLLNKTLDTDYPNTVKWLNGSGREMEEYFKFRGWRSITRTVGYDWAQMNHYAVKSIDSYAIRKFRGNVNNKADKYNDDYWALQDRNEVRDDTMLRYSAHRQAIFDGLLADPVLNRLHHAALERVEARLNTLKKSRDYADFVANLKSASTVPISQVEAKPPKPRDPAEIAKLMSDIESRVTETAKAERAKPPQERAVLPQDSVVRGPVDVSADVPLQWFANHAVELPSDPRLFPPPALIQIEAGKFERNLARNLPSLVPENGRYLELGATSGFAALHLVKTRAGVAITVQQRDAGWQGALAMIATYNGQSLTIETAPPTDLAQVAPDLLNLADPGYRPHDLNRLLAQHRPATILFTGPFWCAHHGDLTKYEAVLASHGYTERLPLDPMIVAGYRIVRDAP